MADTSLLSNATTFHEGREGWFVIFNEDSVQLSVISQTQKTSIDIFAMRIIAKIVILFD
jgi:hypothetical protein